MIHIILLYLVFKITSLFSSFHTSVPDDLKILLIIYNSFQIISIILMIFYHKKNESETDYFFIITILITTSLFLCAYISPIVFYIYPVLKDQTIHFICIFSVISVLLDVFINFSVVFATIYDSFYIESELYSIV